MWVEFVVGSRPCSEGFSPGSPVFLPLQKSTVPNTNLIWKQWMKSHFVEMSLQIAFLLFIIVIVIVIMIAIVIVNVIIIVIVIIIIIIIIIIITIIIIKLN